uniref:DNA-directed RNA polymerase III subunit RPC3 n=1 Tax=Simocephalus serrulatus TaxID=117539 RepID=A0A4Y7NLS3_9CRUS|nr:EOG090X04YD [Simocephalus serrulatus]SVE94199.1 EOG090X04YD [Simocephalus serrulatus]
MSFIIKFSFSKHMSQITTTAGTEIAFEREGIFCTLSLAEWMHEIGTCSTNQCDHLSHLLLKRRRLLHSLNSLPWDWKCFNIRCRISLLFHVFVKQSTTLLLMHLPMNALTMKMQDFLIFYLKLSTQFYLLFTNVVLVNAAARRVDATAGELYHLLLKHWRECSSPDSPTTNVLSFNQIKDFVRRNDGSSPTLLEYFDQYLRVLYEDSSCLVSRVGDAGGGQFALNYAAVFENLACATLDSIVLERFGSKALRLFRLVRIQKYMEQDKMQSSSMIPAKESKMFTYKLLEHNFLQLKELKKGTSNLAPVKSFILFHVDLPQVVRTALQTSYKCLFNAMIRQTHELTDNKRLLDKHERMESLLESLRGEGVAEDELAYLADSMTPAEKSLVVKIQSMSDHLTLGQSQADETILILETYLKFLAPK